MSNGIALYRIQELELTILDHQKRIKEIQQLLGADETLQQVQKQFDEAKSANSKVQAQVRDLELQSQANREKREATEKRLYSGSVKNPKELQDMQQEIESLKRWQSELEDRLLNHMEEADSTSETLELAQALLDETVNSLASEQQELAEEEQLLRNEIDTLLEQRRERLNDVEEQDLKYYNSLRKQKGNRPVSVMEGNTCKVCGVTQTEATYQKVRKSDEFVHCDNCGRILITLR